MSINETGNVEPQTRNGTLSISGIWTIVVCFLIVLLDGLDTTSIAFVAPLLVAEWGVSAAAFTPAFLATSIGAVIGYMACGPLAQRFGARAVGIGSVVLFGLGTALTAASYDIFSLSVLRLISGVGLGGALPVAVSAATLAVPPRQKEVVAMLVASGLSAGGVVGGLIGGPLMQAYGWASIFVLGGVLPLLLAPAFGRVLAKAEPGQATAPGKGGYSPIANLFRNGLSTHTALLWLFAFFIFIATYALTFWIPTLLTSFGFEPAQAPLGAAAFGAGGLAGSVVMMTIVARWGIKNVLMIATLVAMACIAVISQVAISPGLVLPLIGGAGAGLIVGCIGQSALAVSFYPPMLRATGVGWAAAAGRIGSIVGPALGGAMVSFGLPARDIILAAVLPALLAGATLVALNVVQRRKASLLAPR